MRAVFHLLDIKHWRLGILLCFLIAMAATPADPVSMIVIAIPLCCLYFLAAWMWSRPHKQA